MMVSILVPFHNAERYIEVCARSLFEQSYPHCEYIFVDDCSTDGSEELIKELVESEYHHLYDRVQIIRHHENRGVNTARQTALQHASGSYVIFVDSDDWVEVDMVSELVAASEKSKAEMVSCGYREYYTPSKSVSVNAPWIGTASRSLEIVLSQSHAIPNHIWGILISKQLIDDGVIFDPTIKLGEDMTLLVQLLRGAKSVEYVGRDLYNYRQNVKGSLSNELTRGARFNYLRAVCIANRFVGSATTKPSLFALQRLNVKRWLLNRSPQRNAPLTLFFRLYCWLRNWVWLI